MVRKRRDIAAADNSLGLYAKLDEEENVTNDNFLRVTATPVNSVFLAIFDATNCFWLISLRPTLWVPRKEISVRLVLTQLSATNRRRP